MRPSTNPSSSFLLASALALCLAAPAYAQSNDPIKIGVIAEDALEPILRMITG